ncbi:MAG: hypothetical protein JWO50_477 [Candidatus Kaiserbacteria bacterium]|nr:hypothetical protein [Candidatus Kaiserbacteria bacterium]
MDPWNQFVSAVGMGTPAWIPVVGFAFIILTFWSLFWKGLALWHSAHRNQPWWFVILLVVNTAGIVEIIYLFFVAKLTSKDLFHH